NEIGAMGFGYEHIYMKAWHPERAEVVRFLRIVTDADRVPVLVHCQHGADRTGTMCAMYRVVVQAWSKEEAIREMTLGGFGFHEVWQNLPRWIEDLDVESIRKDVGTGVDNGRKPVPMSAEIGATRSGMTTSTPGTVTSWEGEFRLQEASIPIRIHGLPTISLRIYRLDTGSKGTTIGFADAKDGMLLMPAPQAKGIQPVFAGHFVSITSTNTADSGTNLVSLSQLMGHTTTRTTARYISSTQEHHRQVIERNATSVLALVAAGAEEAKTGQKVASNSETGNEEIGQIAVNACTSAL
ncbi:MAG: tyrosine-protein phosphatase, partial [Kiritimatiellae bacterium]|nr:tyrosine-protein phosphatase [Kiritimatiellia bacterium]